MKKTIQGVAAGLIAGAISWVICPVLFGTPEPFDTTAGLIAGQGLLTLVAVVIVFKGTLRALPGLIIGMYAGINLAILVVGTKFYPKGFTKIVVNVKHVKVRTSISSCPPPSTCCCCC